jgi:hypothetical protein
VPAVSYYDHSERGITGLVFLCIPFGNFGVVVTGGLTIGVPSQCPGKPFLSTP